MRPWRFIHATDIHVGSPRSFRFEPAWNANWWTARQQADRWPDGDPTLGFAVYELSDAGIEHRFVPLARVSEAGGYGPGGRPPPEARDYSLAWEKEWARGPHQAPGCPEAGECP